MRPLIVQKYGGACLATPEKVKEVARQVAERQKQGQPLIVVVSAMGQTTDDLVKLAYQISPHPNRRELDMLLSTGERVSMALMSMALSDLGTPAISFTGSQAGVFTDDSHSSAKIIDVKPQRIEEELSRNRVVVLAGFQGVNPRTKEITTLGRGGSDTTAVAMAAHFTGAACEIIKEVDGVCSADPRVVSGARVLNQVSYDSLAEMCFWGAKVLHYRSVELAKTMNVPLSIRFIANSGTGTQVLNEVTMFENQKVLSVNSLKEVHHLEVDAADMAEALNKIEALLSRLQLPWPQILASASEGGHTRLMYTADAEHLTAIERALGPNETGLRRHRPALSSITVTCHGAVASSLPSHVISRLRDAGIRSEKMMLSPLSVTVLVAPEKRESAIKALHSLTT